jgi:hypothetical protein
MDASNHAVVFHKSDCGKLLSGCDIIYRGLTSQAQCLGGSSFPELNFNVISRDLSDFGKLQELL